MENLRKILEHRLERHVGIRDSGYTSLCFDLLGAKPYPQLKGLKAIYYIWMLDETSVMEMTIDYTSVVTRVFNDWAIAEIEKQIAILDDTNCSKDKNDPLYLIVKMEELRSETVKDIERCESGLNMHRQSIVDIEKKIEFTKGQNNINDFVLNRLDKLINETRNAVVE